MWVEGLPGRVGPQGLPGSPGKPGSPGQSAADLGIVEFSSEGASTNSGSGTIQGRSTVEREATSPEALLPGTPPDNAPVERGCSTVEDITVVKKLKKFLRLLLATGYDSKLDMGNMGITVFAPTDAAFAEFFSEAGISNENTVFGNATLSSIILRYHLVPGLKDSKSFINGKKKLKTLLEAADTPCGKSDLDIGFYQEHVTLHMGEKMAKVLSPDNQGCMAVVHIIDSVLVPCPLNSFGA